MKYCSALITPNLCNPAKQRLEELELLKIEHELPTVPMSGFNNNNEYHLVHDRQEKSETLRTR